MHTYSHLGPYQNQNLGSKAAAAAAADGGLQSALIGGQQRDRKQKVVGRVGEGAGVEGVWGGKIDRREVGVGGTDERWDGSFEGKEEEVEEEDRMGSDTLSKLGRLSPPEVVEVVLHQLVAEEGAERGGATTGPSFLGCERGLGFGDRKSVV